MRRKRPTHTLVPAKAAIPAIPSALLRDVRGLIEQARDATARAVNSALVVLYWSVGDRIRRDILKEKRADYGKQIVGALSRQLGWSHFLLLLPLKNELKREFYAEMCRVERWSVRTLRQKIGGMLFERTALSKKPAKLARQELARLRTADQLSPDLVFRDPYLLDFLGLKDTYSEKDLEAAILREMEAFLLELGAGFTFVARQKRMVIDGKDFSLDLLFFHRKLHRLIAIDLKLGEFQPADKGQMELYLRWLDKHEREPGEASPLGLILCESAGAEQVELLQLSESGIRLATYLTELPPKALLQKKLRAAAELARHRLKEAGQ